MLPNLSFEEILNFLFSTPDDSRIQFTAVSITNPDLSFSYTCRVVDAIYILPAFKFSFNFNYKLL